MAQIINITSEALQATVRRLLPSQQGFGEDLQAQNVIVPILDLTPTAEGSQLPDFLQRAYGFDDITSTETSGSASTVIINSPGFYQVNYQLVCNNSLDNPQFTMSDGISTKVLVEVDISLNTPQTISDQMVLFVQTGESVTQTSNNNAYIRSITRQIATVNGEIVNPTGFAFQ